MRQEVKRSTWRVIWDNEHCCDGFDSASLGQAKQDVFDLLIEWACQQQSEWESETPNKDEVIDWDYMICTCYAYVGKYNPDTNEYDLYWEPSDEELKQIGFVPWEERTA